MDFSLTTEQKQIQKAVKDFVKGEFDKTEIAEMEAHHQYPEKIWKKAADLGFIGIHFPEKYSGQGMGVMENILVAVGAMRRRQYRGRLPDSGGFCLGDHLAFRQ